MDIEILDSILNKFKYSEFLKPELKNQFDEKIEVLENYLETINTIVVEKNSSGNIISNTGLMKAYFNQIIMGLKIERVFPGEFSKANKRICKYLDPLPRLSPAAASRPCMVDIFDIFKIHYNVYSRVRNAINTMDSIEIVRRILRGEDISDCIREIPKGTMVCDECDKIYHTKFHVPDFIWDQITGSENSNLCMDCFIKLAEQKEWDLWWGCDQGQYPHPEPIITPPSCDKCYVRHSCHKNTHYGKNGCMMHLRSSMRHYPDYVPYVNRKIKGLMSKEKDIDSEAT